MILFPLPGQTYNPQSEAAMRTQIAIEFERVTAKVQDLEVRPRVNDILISFDSAGRAYITIKCNADTLTFRYSVSDVAAPADTTVRAADLNEGSKGVFSVDGPFQPGAVLYVSVLPYAGPDGDGTEGPLYTDSATFGVLLTDECRAAVIASDATTITVRVTATTSGVGRPQVALTTLTGATLLDGLAVGVYGDSPQEYIFARPAAMAGNGNTIFTAVFPDAVEDVDELVIPEQGLDVLYLGVRPTLLETTATEALIRIAAVNPIPQGTDSVQLAYTLDPTGTLDPVSPQLVTPTSTYSGAAGTYVDVWVPRPVGDTPATFRVTATSLGGNRIPDSDVLYVPGRSAIPASLEIGVDTSDPAVYVISWSVGATDTAAVNIDGVGFVTPAASPITVERGAIYGGVEKTYTFRSTGELLDVRTETIIVPKQDLPAGPTDPAITAGFTLSPGVDYCTASPSLEVAWLDTNMPVGATFRIDWAVLAGLHSSGAPTGGDYPVTSPYNITDIALCAASEMPRVRITISAYDVESRLIAQRTEDHDAPPGA